MARAQAKVVRQGAQVWPMAGARTSGLKDVGNEQGNT